MAKAKKKKYSASDKAILGIGYVLLGAFVLSILVPLLYVVIASFMDPNVLNSQGISFDVRKWTIDAYRRVLENNMIWRGFANSFFYSLVFTIISVLVTLLAAYPMSKNLNDAKLQPLQLVLRSILVQNTPQPGMIADIQSTAQMAKVAELLKYATIIVSSLPLLIMYPFFQKYFDQGIMVGSVKG